MRPNRSKTVKLFAIVLATGLGFVLLCVSILLYTNRKTLNLPTPSGKFEVGRIQDEWTDKSRHDPLAPGAGISRKLTVWIWYPAEPGNARSARAPYIPMALMQSLNQHRGLVLGKLLTHDLAQVIPNSIADALPASSQSPYPVLLLKPGFGMLALDYSTIAEDLASNGYVVIASDSPYSTIVVKYRDGSEALRNTKGHPDESSNFDEKHAKDWNLVLDTWAADNAFILSQLAKFSLDQKSAMLAGKIDFNAVGALGHSFGGAVSLLYCHQDQRCKASVDLDGALFAKAAQQRYTKPTSFLLSDHAREMDTPPGCTIMRAIFAASESVPGGQSNITALAGSGHFNFTDRALIQEQHLGRLSGLIGPINQSRALAITSRTIRTFFDKQFARNQELAATRGTKDPELGTLVFPQICVVQAKSN